jgi:hypothetical protein
MSWVELQLLTEVSGDLGLEVARQAAARLAESSGRAVFVMLAEQDMRAASFTTLSPCRCAAPSASWELATQ